MYYSENFWIKFNMPSPIKEFKFCHHRDWRVDFAWPDVKLAIELEGAIFKKGNDGQKGGRHNRPSGFLKDMEKYNMLTETGWYLLRYQPNKVDYDQISRVYCNLRFNRLEKVLYG